MSEFAQEICYSAPWQCAPVLYVGNNRRFGLTFYRTKEKKLPDLSVIDRKKIASGVNFSVLRFADV
jgi:hypothetical protein